MNILYKMYKNIYEEHYTPGRIKGTSQYVEDYAKFSKKKMAQHFIPDEQITLKQVYNIYGDTVLPLEKRKKKTLEKFIEYLKQTYPNN